MSATTEPDEHYNITLKIEKVSVKTPYANPRDGRGQQAERVRVVETLVDLRVQGADVVQAITKTRRHLEVEVEVHADLGDMGPRQRMAWASGASDAQIRQARAEDVRVRARYEEAEDRSGTLVEPRRVPTDSHQA